MAITIQDQPITIKPKPAYSPIDYLVTSTSTAESGFKLIVSVHKDPNGGNTKVSTLQLNTIPNATQLVTDIQNIVKSFVTSSYSILDGDTIGVASTDLSEFKLAFQEYYDGGLQGSAASGNVFQSWNASPKYTEFSNGVYEDWSLDQYEVNQFLNGFRSNKTDFFNFSSSDNWLKVRPTQKIQANWIIRNGFLGNQEVWLKTLDSNFTALQTYTLNASNDDAQYSLDVGFSELSSHSWDVTFSDTNVKYYVIGIYDDNDLNFMTEFLLFEVDECEDTYTDYELHWLNRKGGYDSFVFSGKSNQTTSIDKSFAKYTTRGISGTSITHNTYAQRKRAFHTSTKESYELNSRLLKDFEVEGLEDLMSSPEVYWKSGSAFFSVNVEGTTYKHSKSENGEVFNLALTMEVDNSDNRQW